MPQLPHYQAIFERSPVAECLLTASPQPTVLAANDAFLIASGRSRDELVNKRLFEAFPVDPDGINGRALADCREALERVLASGEAVHSPRLRFSVRVTLADGSVSFEDRYWSTMDTPIFDSEGRLKYIAHRAEDVTERWHMERALHRLSARQAFLLELGDRLRPLASADEVVDAASAMLGQYLDIARVSYAEIDDAQGTFFVRRNWLNVGRTSIVGERRRLDDFGPEIIALLRAGQPMVVQDVTEDPRTRQHADAYTSIAIRANLAIPLVKSGQLSIVLSLQHDAPHHWSPEHVELAAEVAERTWATAESARAQQELRDAERRKDEFLAMLAHELRNPLAPISVAAELLSRKQLDAAGLARTSQVIARQARHMTGLVDDLLDVSRVTRGLVSITATPQDLRSVVTDAVEQVRPLIEAQRHALQLGLPPQPAMVRGDAKRLVQIVTNLLNNAAKYTQPGGRIELTLSVEPQQVRLMVRDNGIGIAHDLQPHIFELFAQAQRTPDRRQGGLGIGLALVRSLVALHGGQVSGLSDGLDHGSTFFVTLPRLAPTAPPGDGQTGDGAVRGLRLLVVDDNTDAADMLRMLLEAVGHTVTVANTPQDALDIAAGVHFDAGLLDIGLPDMDGYELVRRLRAMSTGAATTWIALTGYGQEEDRRRALLAGFTEHLGKPADPQRLFAFLEAVRAP
jgi:PAS domain S-box-containing protein